MKRIIAAASAACLALVSAGCAKDPATGKPSFTYSVNATTTWLASPTTTQAASNLRNFAAAFDCGFVVGGASLSLTIENEVNAGNAAIGTTGKVYAVASSVCIALGGTPKALPSGTVIQAVASPAAS